MIKIDHKKILYYSPRVLAIIMTILSYSFVINVFIQGFTFTSFLYSLIPGTIALILTILAFKKHLLGGGLFLVLGLLYLIVSLTKIYIPLLSTLIICIPLILTGILFIVNFYYNKDYNNESKQKFAFTPNKQSIFSKLTKKDKRPKF